MEPAQGGDPKAQTYVGEIYEKQGDFASAAQWYRKAADQGYAPAQIDLVAASYEQGKGVPKDGQQALNWYRKASVCHDVWLADPGAGRGADQADSNRRRTPRPRSRRTRTRR